MFELVSEDFQSKARHGRLTTAHAAIEILGNTSHWFVRPEIEIGCFEISNGPFDRSRGNVSPRRWPETKCSGGLDRRGRYRLAQHHIVDSRFRSRRTA
jgi:hypothetical protein